MTVTVQVGTESRVGNGGMGRVGAQVRLGQTFGGGKLFGKWETFSSGAQRVSRLEAKGEI